MHHINYFYTVLFVFREHIVNVKNDGFTRKMLEVTSGDLVWIHWRPSKVGVYPDMVIKYR